ncbi:MAG: DUF4350 domain-containing protein [Myxococcota bacterium]
MDAPRVRDDGVVRPFRLGLVTLVVVTALLGSARVAHAGAFDLNDASWEGCTELLSLAREVLSPDRVVLSATLDWERLDARDGVLVLHPVRPLDAEEAASFMKAGGRLAVVDDFGEGHTLLEHFKIERRTLPGRPLVFLRGNPAFAVATPAFDSVDDELLGLHPTVADVEQVVLNHSSALDHPDLTPVLEVRLAQGKAMAVAVAGQIDGPTAKGRLFAMGDPSAFINQMLRYPGNRAFATGLVTYLADGDATDRRKGKLFVVTNEFGEKGTFGGVTPIRKAVDRKLREMGEAFETLREDGFPWWLHVVAAALCAVVVGWWVAKALVRLYVSRVPRFARPLPLVAQSGMAGRAAVLASDASPPALVLLELRSALGESLADRLRVPGRPSLQELVDRTDAAVALPASLRKEAKEMMRTMRAAEEAVVKGTTARVSVDEVERAATTVASILDAASGVSPRGGDISDPPP